MWLWIDLIIVAILLICIFIYAKRGFVKSIFGVIGFVAAIVLSFILSTPLSNFTYDKAIYPAVSTALTETISNTQTAVNESVLDALPDFLKQGVDFENIDFNNVADIDTPQMMADKICENVVKPAAVNFLKIIFSLILFVVLSIVFKFIVKLLNKLFSFSVMGKLNATLGGVIGAVMGIIIAILFVLIINLIMSFNGDFAIFTSENINGTILYNFILNLLPIKL